MKKYSLLLLLFLLFPVVGWWIYSSRLNTAPGLTFSSETQDSSSYAEATGAAGENKDATRAPAIASAIKEAVQDPPALRTYSLHEDAKQEDLLKTVLSSVSGNLPVSSLVETGWENDWSDNGYDRKSTKTFYRSSINKDKVILYSYLARAGTDYAEVVMWGSMQKCYYPDQDALISVLREEGFSVERPTAPIHGFGSAYWKSVYQVRRGSLSGLTFYDSSTGITGCLKLILTDGKKEKALFTTEPDFQTQFSTELPGKLFKDLESSGIAGLLGDNWWKVKGISTSTGPLYAGPLEALAKAYSTVVHTSVKEEQAPAFRVFEGYLLRQIFSRGGYYEAVPEAGGGGKPFREILGQNGIKYIESHYGGVYSQKISDLEIYDKSPGSYWGQFAFLQSMSEGFSSSGDCYYGLLTDQVIKRGTAFLEKHPDSPFYSDVLFLQGQAYETLYNQGLAAEACDPYLGKSCKELTGGNENNGKKASELYTAALSASGGEKYRVYVENILPRIRTRSRTYCYKYFSRCD